MLGSATPELQTSALHPFMDQEEFLAALKNTAGCMLLAEEEGHLAGFIYADWKADQAPQPRKWACLGYIVVDPKFRKRGIAQSLFDSCIAVLKQNGVTNLYTWANVGEQSAVIRFFSKQGLSEGQRYVWMDGRI